MNLFKISIITFFLFFSCNSSSISPKEVAQKACECQTLLQDLQAFSDCNALVTQMKSEYKSDFEWMDKYREEYINCLQDLISE
ncbi:MAG: hypothetical protein CMP49_06155 [Flavobacteriales bacterium]|jgi:hypothetical protein|nr:hypothetical protein [Flavobacteriales bacterium]|tara:strand:+ start:20745 stop:20993 length:249 start_codon:yes stop_codon:yes gene_type:complete